MGILRVDVRSDHEKEEMLFDIFSLITPQIEKLINCKGVLTKGAIFAIDRIEALKKIGFKKSDNLLVSKNNFSYDGYWIY